MSVERPETLKTVVIDGEEVPAAVLLKLLYNGARPLGMGWLNYDPAPLTVERAQELLDLQWKAVGLQDWVYFDYLWGRPLKVRFGPVEHPDLTETSRRLYDRDQGSGAFDAAVREARGKSPL